MLASQPVRIGVYLAASVRVNLRQVKVLRQHFKGPSEGGHVDDR